MKFALRDLFWLTLIIGLALAAVGSLGVTRWDGFFALTIHPTSKSNRSIVSMSCVPMPSIERAEFYLNQGAASGDQFEECKFQNGFVAYLPTFGTSNVFGVNIHRGEWKYAVILATYADGSESMAIVEAPAGRGPRNVAVALP